MSLFVPILVSFGILTAVLVFLFVSLKRILPKPAPSCLPGPPNGTAKVLFAKAREDAFLLHAKDFAPSQTLNLDTAISSFDPAVLRDMFMSRENSIGRSIVYRLVANIMPSSDGILFSQDEEWRKRHSLLTSLFQPRMISMYTSSAFEGALRVVFMHQESEEKTNAKESYVEVDYDSSASLVTSIDSPVQPPLGARSFGHDDVITLVRWAAMRNYFAWALGVELDAWGLPEDAVHGSGGQVLYPKDEVSSEHHTITRSIRRLGRVLDAYARVCFEIMPVAERKDVVSWLHEYSQLWAVRRRLMDAVKVFLSYHPNTEHLVGRKHQSVQPPLVQDVSNEYKRDRALNPSGASARPTSDTFVTRLLQAKWDVNSIASELNHLHGAHKAVAFITTCTLVELSSPGAESVRNALIKEFTTVCGLPPTDMSFEDLMQHVHKHATDTEEEQAQLSWRLPTRRDMDAGRLPVLSSIWKETLRRHPVSLGVMRKTGESIDIPLGNNDEKGENTKDNCTLDAGYDLVLLLHALHHHEPFWGKDAHTWLPNRWVQGSPYWEEKRAKGETMPPRNAFPAKVKDAFYPFLDGLRRCAGMSLAEQQFIIFVYVLVGIFDMRAVGPKFPSKEELPTVVEEAKKRTKAIQDKEGITPPGPNAYYLPDIGGGLALLPDTVLLERQGGIALLVDTVQNDQGEEELRPRWHLVKRADMFTAIDGRIQYTFSRRNV